MKKKQEKKIIEKIRKQLPVFQCREGCSDCCGAVMPMSRYEYEAIPIKRMAFGVSCPYITKNGCEIYEYRPIICRMFGVVSRMKCSHGCGADVMLSDEEEFDLLKQMAGLSLEFRDMLLGDDLLEGNYDITEIHKRICSFKM